MTLIDKIPNIEFLGDAVPFVGRIREIIEAIQLFEDFDPEELEGLARYMRCYRAPLGAEIIHEGDNGDFMLLLCGLMLTLFLGFAKRSAELLALPEDSAGHRRVLEHYTAPMLDQFSSIAATGPVIS